MKFCRACRAFIPEEQQNQPCPAVNQKGPGANTSHRFNYESSYEQAASERLRSQPIRVGSHFQETINRSETSSG